MNCFKHYSRIPDLDFCAHCEKLEICQSKRSKRILKHEDKILQKKINHNFEGEYHEADIK
jgi:hypothetical protein